MNTFLSCVIKAYKIRETLYAAFKPGEGGTKHALFQWSLPDGNARHVPESVTSSCMQEGCGRHFGLLGKLA